ncbi:dual serine/threonine and tyrosine protein kinase-like isoform X1 [Dreissena polymorpha]|uniref:dual serine/threonine and tyrosine protein kinase-like isoform X1 n=1 Tax=Dreissena polymorpha TaxID=45954 RepID=UPI0022641D19|nr:dual serine/threonine and tyrosine protein kinase-like isoform X1 [Dreissena polymorpha]
MSAGLATGIKRYRRHCGRLKRILDETKRCYEDINSNTSNENDKIQVSDLVSGEEGKILSVAHKQPGILVLGQNQYCKAKIVNEIFNRTIFPNFEGTTDTTKCRTVRFKNGENISLSLEVPGGFTLPANLEAYNGPWNTIPRKDLEVSENESASSDMGMAILEVSFNHQLLRNDCTLVVAGTSIPFEDEIKRCIEHMSPIVVYAFQAEQLSSKEIQDLELLKSITSFQPVCFVRIPTPETPIPTVSGSPFGVPFVQPDTRVRPHQPSSPQPQNILNGYDVISDNEETNVKTRFEDNNNDSEDDGVRSGPASSASIQASHRVGKVFSMSFPPELAKVVYEQLCKVGYLSDTPGVRNVSQTMIQDYCEVDSILITEWDIFSQAFVSFSEQIMQRYLVNAVTVLNQTHMGCLQQFILFAFDMARDVLVTPKKIEFAREKEEGLFKSLFQIAVDKGDEVRDMIETTIADSQGMLIQKANEYDFIGVDFNDKGEIITPKGLKICTGQIQELVLGGLNQAVAGKLVSSVNILRDSYTGTLTRCLESLERVEQEHPDSHSTTEALKQILNAAYQVEITVRSSSTFIHLLLQRMKQLVQGMPWRESPRIDDEWKKKVAMEMLASLSAARLAKSISSQIKDRLNKSHSAFSTALRQLEMKHTGRLDKIEEERLKLRKVHAPRVAKVALESTSLKDLILYGMPVMGREIGRGQYGVVYSCDTWATYSPCAVKSVVPPDDKHWNDLALEFFYTKNINEHDRIVMLRGSIIDYSYGGGTTPAVLLVMDRLQRDLYTAIKQHLEWVPRLQVAMDVVEGIRYLHSQGLVHRDIKLKNVLLDKDNRAKITDLGFCKPEAMMSGSIVGTPIHMAPELFSGRYDSSVDVYAFGILFWYICAGNVRLPQNFELCANKDQLWNNVKRGLRPEQLTVFDDECWDLMSECWEGEPVKRPLLGDVHIRLQGIYDRYRNKPGTKTAREATVKTKNVKYKLRDP